jgi:hypothetical protein
MRRARRRPPPAEDFGNLDMPQGGARRQRRTPSCAKLELAEGFRRSATPKARAYLLEEVIGEASGPLKSRAQSYAQQPRLMSARGGGPPR